MLRTRLRTVFILSALLAGFGLSVVAQTRRAQADMNQLMRGVLYPAANVVFFAQADNPADVKPAPGRDPSMATDPLESTFGGWQAVENAALALTESADLLLIPGRTCSNGAAAPLSDPDWAKFVQELRDAGMKAYKSAQSKNQDQMVEVAETLTTVCANCHRKWRDRRTLAERCK
jgi:hypothetical protein